MSPVSSAMVSASTLPMPLTVCSAGSPLRSVARREWRVRARDLLVEAVHHGKVGLHRKGSLVWQQRQRIDVRRPPALDKISGRSETQVAGQQVLMLRIWVVRCLTNWLRFQQIAHGARFTRIDIPSGRMPASSRCAGAGHRLHRRCTLSPSYCLTAAVFTRCTTYPCLLQTIDQPVPVERRFHRYALDLPGARAQREMMPSRLLGKRAMATRSVSSSTTTMLLLECKSIPA